MCLEWVDLDLVLNDLLAKPNGFDGVVLATRSELKRWSSCKNQSARVVLVDGDMHNARVSIRVIIKFLYPNSTRVKLHCHTLFLMIGFFYHDINTPLNLDILGIY